MFVIPITNRLYDTLHVFVIPNTFDALPARKQWRALWGPLFAPSRHSWPHCPLRPRPASCTGCLPSVCCDGISGKACRSHPAKAKVIPMKYSYMVSIRMKYSYRVRIELSDGSELLDTINYHIKKWSVNAWNSRKWCITLSLLILTLKTTD